MSSRFVPLMRAILCICLFTTLSALAQDSRPPMADSADSKPQDHPARGCAFTKPPATLFFPPGVQETSDTTGGFYFGTPKLSVFVLNSPIGGGEKIAIFSDGYDWKTDPQPDLSLSLKRLDAPARVLNDYDSHDSHGSKIVGFFPANGSYIPESGSFIMSGVNFPSAGCWEITARFKGEELKIVYLVR
jgi:hypothetical protein